MDSALREKLSQIVAVVGMSGLVLYVLISQFVLPKPLPIGKVKTDRVKVAKPDASGEVSEPVAEKDSGVVVPEVKVPETTSTTEKAFEPPRAIEPIEPEPIPSVVPEKTIPAQSPPPPIVEDEPSKPRTLDNVTELDLEFVQGWDGPKRKAFLLHRASLGRGMLWEDVLQVQGLNGLSIENLRRWLEGE